MLNFDVVLYVLFSCANEKLNERKYKLMTSQNFYVTCSVAIRMFVKL